MDHYFAVPPHKAHLDARMLNVEMTGCPAQVSREQTLRVSAFHKSNHFRFIQLCCCRDNQLPAILIQPWVCFPDNIRQAICLWIVSHADNHVGEVQPLYGFLHVGHCPKGNLQEQQKQCPSRGMKGSHCSMGLQSPLLPVCQNKCPYAITTADRK